MKHYCKKCKHYLPDYIALFGDAKCRYKVINPYNDAVEHYGYLSDNKYGTCSNYEEK